MAKFRAAYLTAAGISCLLMRMQKPFVTIGIDGSVYRFHPKFGKILDAKINDLLPKHLDVCSVASIFFNNLNLFVFLIFTPRTF